jgi:small subunit ribosomal protein S5
MQGRGSDNRFDQNDSGLTEKGGRHLTFNAMVVIGDGNGKVGLGMGKGVAVPDAVRKGVAIAKKAMIDVPMHGSTIPHAVHVKYGASKVFMKPATTGAGIIAGGAVRAVMEVAGIKDISAKALGSRNPINVVKATVAGLQMLRPLVGVPVPSLPADAPAEAPVATPEPVVAEVATPEAPETVAAEAPVATPEPVVAEVATPEAPETVAAEAPVATPEPVVAEVATPEAPETVAAEGMALEEPVAESVPVEEAVQEAEASDEVEESKDNG